MTHAASTDTSLLQQMKQIKPAEEIFDFLKKIKAKIQSFVTGKPESPIGKIGTEMAQKYNEVLDLYVQGIKAASDNLAHTENSGNARLEMSRYAKAEPLNEYIGALYDSEWERFYRAIGGDNEYQDFKIGNNGIYMVDTKSLIVYDQELGKPVVKAVYNFGDYEYTIHDKEINLPEAFMKIWEVTHDSKRAETVLQRYNSLYGTVFKKYSIESSRYVDIPQASNPNRGTAQQGTSGTSVSGGTQQTGGIIYQSRDSDYLSAVEHGDMETAQRLVDEAAKAAGYTVKGYHQTAREFTVFNTDNPQAGLNDSETPNGIFFKTNDHDIGLEGKKQVAGYLNVGKALSFKDRAEANRWYREHVDGYKALDDKMTKAVKKIDDKMNAIESEMFRDGVTDSESDALDSQWNSLLEEMRGVENDYRGKLRELLDGFFLNGTSGYDSIHLGYDGHRYVEGKREDVETYILFKNTQVKSADPVTYDDAGKVIPLSQRFDTSTPDIRYQDRIDELFDIELSDDMDDTALLRHHLTTHNEAIGEVLNRTRDIKYTSSENRKKELRRLVKDVVGKYGFTSKAEKYNGIRHYRTQKYAIVPFLLPSQLAPHSGFINILRSGSYNIM